MPELSIVIRCYNEEQHIGRLLSGIMQQTNQDFEIIIVDSGSTDGTLDVVSRYPVKIVRIAPQEFSFGRSLNRGCAAACGEILVFASAHVYPLYDDWLEKLVRPFGEPAVALAYGGQRGNEVTKYSERQLFARWFPSTSDLDQQQPFCNNANAAVRRSLWTQFPYNETLTGLEDLEWATRVTAAGKHKIAYVSNAVVAHVHNETPRRIFNRYRREAIALRRICPSERFTLRDFAYLLTTNIISDLYHAARDGVFVGNVASILTFRAMQFCGTYWGYRLRGDASSELRQTFYYPRGFTRPTDQDDEAQSRRPIDYGPTKRHETVGSRR